MIAVGNDELGEYVGETARCPHCGKEHPIIWGEDKKTGEQSKMIGAVKCGNGDMYLVAVAGRSIRFPRKKEDTMRHDNPGAWPDQVREEVKKEPLKHPLTGEPLYTAAEMKAARREIVERIKVIVPAYCWSKEAIEAIEKLKEEIENEK